jgi:hypothetical protein
MDKVKYFPNILPDHAKWQALHELPVAFQHSTNFGGDVYAGLERAIS